MQKHYNVVPVKDIFISLAEKLPKNLFTDTVDAQGKFTIEFISRLTDDQLTRLREEATKKKDEIVFLEFSTCTEGSKGCSTSLKTFSNFDWSKVLGIKISGDTCPYIDGPDDYPYNYISVVFVLSNSWTLYASLAIKLERSFLDIHDIIV